MAATSATKGREAEGDLSVPMQLARATFWTEDEATFEGTLFLHLSAETHAGPETVLDRLNAPDHFLVLGVADDSPVILLNKAQIIRVDLPVEAGPQEVGEFLPVEDVERVRCDSSTEKNSPGASSVLRRGSPGPVAEAFLHPLVRQAIDVLVRRSTQKVIVIEAIKLLEGPLKEACDCIWVTTAPYEAQAARLGQKRGMTREAARQRIYAQSPQEAKLAQAHIVIHNDGSFEDTWRQVLVGWQKVLPGTGVEPAQIAPAPVTPAPANLPVVERAGPRQAQGSPSW